MKKCKHETFGLVGIEVGLKVVGAEHILWVKNICYVMSKTSAVKPDEGEVVVGIWVGDWVGCFVVGAIVVGIEVGYLVVGSDIN